ncbi:MAG: 3-methylfumaryl-CoA hydratase [Pseudohongiellaceae bacterium]
MNALNDEYKQWIGRTESKVDLITSKGPNSLAATLDREKLECNRGDALPPLWHWIFFLEMTPHRALSSDGHPRKGGFLPPIELPRRMWAGSRLTFHKPLQIGDEASKTSTIKSIQFKEGRSGSLAFVRVNHEISGSAGLSISEEQDIVYRDNPPLPVGKPQATPAPAQHDYALSVNADPVLLFCYSALTLNSHRIHYDRDYATQIEGYPGLIVHGPLLATYLLELVARQYPAKEVHSFEFKAVSPVFDGADFTICGLEPDDDGKCELWIKNKAGELCVKGSALVA